MASVDRVIKLIRQDWQAPVNFCGNAIHSPRLSLHKDNATLAEKIGLPIDSEEHGTHPWGILFTILGTVLLDFDADSCQSPSRAYLLDVTIPGI